MHRSVGGELRLVLKLSCLRKRRRFIFEVVQISKQRGDVDELTPTFKQCAYVRSNPCESVSSFHGLSCALTSIR